jgi:hypothetical protein
VHIILINDVGYVVQGDRMTEDCLTLHHEGWTMERGTSNSVSRVVVWVLRPCSLMEIMSTRTGSLIHHGTPSDPPRWRGSVRFGDH